MRFYLSEQIKAQAPFRDAVKGERLERQQTGTWQVLGTEESVIIHAS